MSAELRIEKAIDSASAQVFEEDIKPQYSFIKLGIGNGYEHDFISDGQPEEVAVLGRFTVGNSMQISRLVFSETADLDDAEKYLARGTIEYGFDLLNCIKPKLPRRPDSFIDEALADQDLYFGDRNATRLIAGVYALKSEINDGYESWLAYNSALDLVPLRIREAVLRRVKPGRQNHLCGLPAEILNQNSGMRANIAISIVKEILPKDRASLFAGESRLEAVLI